MRQDQEQLDWPQSKVFLVFFILTASVHRKYSMRSDEASSPSPHTSFRLC